jgi:CRISPR-associated protein Cas1
MSPGLGIVHEGNPRAFVLDIADLYKTETTIPLAFTQANSDSPGRDVMRALRENFRLLRLLPRMVDDIHFLLGAGDTQQEWDVNDLYLWGPDGATVAAGNNWGDGE